MNVVISVLFFVGILIIFRALRGVQEASIKPRTLVKTINVDEKTIDAVRDNHSSKSTMEWLLSFSGRMPRGMFFKTILISNFFAFIFGFGFGYFKGWLSIVFAVPMFAAIMISWAAIIKRYHDINLSGWLFVVQIIAHNIASAPSNPFFLSIVVDAIFALPLLIKKGTVGANKYGSDPLLK